MSNLWHLMQKIPDDVIRECILPYTYSPQPPQLCADIRSFYNTYIGIREIYQLAYPLDDERNEWLSNDIGRYLNNDFATMHGYRIFYLNVYRRIFMNHQKNTDDIIECIKKTEENNYPNDIKIHIGLLTPNERSTLKDFLMDYTLMGY
jgi:hypothetical protein